MVYFDTRKKWLVADFNKLRRKYPFQKSIISTVRRKLPAFWNSISKSTCAFILDHKLPIPVQNHYDTPKTLGKDRLAACIGAFKKYKGNNLVIDTGTCLTYDFIDKKGNYLGGNISPGIDLRLKAMHQFTASLPSVKRGVVKKTLGKSTKEAINNGAIIGVGAEIEGYLSRISDEYGHINVILTGGGAAFFGDFVKSKIFVDSNLVLIGLNEIIEYQDLN